MPRLVCIVEGKGDVEAVPILCARILHHIGAHEWFVDRNPIRQPRGRIVDERVQAPNRFAAVEPLRGAVELALVRPANAILIVCDSDDDCAGTWGPSAAAVVQDRIPGGAVMAVREFESWLLASARPQAARGAPVERIRGAKEELNRILGRYKPTQHQARLTRAIDIDVARRNSPSFDKLVRTLIEICA